MKVKSLSRAQLSATPWTAAYQAPPSMGFSRQEYWSGVPLPSPTNMPALQETLKFSSSGEKKTKSHQNMGPYKGIKLTVTINIQIFITF